MTIDWLLDPPLPFEGETPPGQPPRVTTLPTGVVRNSPPTNSAGGASDEWVPLGPSVVLNGQADLHPRVSGRVRAIAVSPDGKRIYAGTALGGTWYSGDSGARWMPLDFFASTRDLTGVLAEANALSVGAVAVAFGAADDGSQDVVYVGTGEQKSRGYWSLPDRVLGVGIRVATGPVPAVLAGGPAADPWTLEATNLAREAVYGVVVAPFGVFAATTKGLFRRPAGDKANWERVNTGLGDGHYSDLLLASGEGAGGPRLYVSKADGHVAWSDDGQDGGAHWHAVALPDFPQPVFRANRTQQQLADALLESSGFAGTVALADVSDDAKAPDARWATASSNDVDTIVRVGFPTPPGNVGGQQRFAAAVRKNAASGAGTPTARIDLYESGTLKASGTERPVIAADKQTITQEFDLDALAIADPTGAGIEARVFTTKSGGAAAGARASADIGAVSWDQVTYQATARAERIRRVALARGNAPGQAVVYALADGPRLWRIRDSTAARVLGLPFDLFGDAVAGTDQSEYDMAIAVHPSADAVHRDRIVVAGSARLSPRNEWNASMFSARLEDPFPRDDWRFPGDAARHWAGVGVHPDVHELAWVTGTGGADELWVGCDGGVFRSRPFTPAPPDDEHVTFAWEPRNDGLASVEAIYLAQHEASASLVAVGFHDDGALVLAGTQDNGAQLRIGLEAWQQPRGGGGDAGGVAIDPNAPRRMLAQATKTLWRRSLDGGASFDDVTLFQPPPAAAGAAVQSAYVDAQKAETAAAGFYCVAAAIDKAGTTQLVVGTNRVWYSEDWGSTWRTLPTGTDPYGAAVAGAPNPAQDVLAAGESEQRIVVLRWAGPDRLYALTGTGIWRLDRAGAAWAAPMRLYNRAAVAAAHKAKNPPPSDQIPDDTPLTELAVQDPAAGRVYAGTTGAGRQHVWFHDGTRWRSAGLAVDSPVHAIIVDPDHNETVYVGTDVGVWRGVGTFPAGGDPTWAWEHYSNGLPEASCVDMVIHKPTRVLRAALRGRGVWEVALDGVVQGPEAFLRAHPYDARRRPVPSPAGRDPLADPPADLRLDASPDVRVWRAPGQPVFVPNPMALSAGFNAWRMQLALLAAGRPVELTGRYDVPTRDAIVARKAALGLPEAPFFDASVWNALLGQGAAEANRLPFGDPPDHAALAGQPPILPGPLRDEPDLGAAPAASCATSDRARVFVVVHARFWRALAAGRVAVALLRTPFAGNADLSGTAALPADWATALRGDIAGNTAVAFFGNPSWSYANQAQAFLRPPHDVDAAGPQVVGFDVDLAAPAWPAVGWLLLAVVHAEDDRLVTTEVDVATLVRTDHHVAARSVRRG
jgi:hypothetical protein